MAFVEDKKLIETLQLAASEHGLSCFEQLSSDTTVQLISDTTRYSVYCVKDNTNGTSCMVKYGSNEDPTEEAASAPGENDVNEVVRSEVIEREAMAIQTFNEIAHGSSPTIIAFSGKANLIVLEDYSDHVSLQTRIHVQDNVDQGVTCNIARLLAGIHKLTHVTADGGEQFREKFRENKITPCNAKHIFDDVLNLSMDSSLSSRLLKKGTDLLNNQQFKDSVNALKLAFETSKECVIVGNLNISNIFVKDGNVKFTDLRYAGLGPCSFDLGTIIAHYVIAHYSQMLTEQNNDFHHQICYQVQAAISKTLETYMEEQSAFVGSTREQYKAELLSQIAGFTALEIVRRVLTTQDNTHVQLSNSTREESLMAGERLILKWHGINHVGRFLMIGLALC